MAATPKTKKITGIQVPSAHDWRTTDSGEINKRRLRARDESFTITNADPQHPIFSNFQVKSASGLTYSVEIRDLRQRQFACDCVDFRINGLGTCKHVEAVLLHLEARFRRLFQTAQKNGSGRVEVVVDSASDGLRVLSGRDQLPRAVHRGIKLSNGRQNFLAKLQQLMGPQAISPKTEFQRPIQTVPADRALAFCQRARDTINGALVQCEERYPTAGAHSVLVVVVDGNPAQHRPRLEGLHAELFGPERAGQPF